MFFVCVCGSEVEIRNLQRCEELCMLVRTTGQLGCSFSRKGAGRMGRRLGTVTSPAAGAKEVRSTRSLSAFRA